MKRILHICAGWEDGNGAAVAARLIAGEQTREGDCEVRLRTWASPLELRRADEVWIHCAWKPCLWWASLWAKRSIRMAHGSFDPVRLAYHGWKKRLVGAIERWTLRRAVRVLATCGAEAEWISAYEPRAAVATTDMKRFFRLQRPSVPRVTDRPWRFLYLGRRHPLKGVQFLEAAVAKLNGSAELRIASGKSRAELEELWRWADVLWLPTLSDNFGLVVAEALERGIMVVTTDGAPAWSERDGIKQILGYRGADAMSKVEMLRATAESLIARVRSGDEPGLAVRRQVAGAVAATIH